jgi:exodeoxyribonuclease VII large subunit
VTSPTGAVIRDILHRLADRFPRRVVVWPVAVQGENAAAQVAAAIEGFNRLTPNGTAPRPELIIVARGGGSLEDLMAFNEEIVVRAAAASAIPLISAVGHETDTTLIDHASDRRAPTPTAAAEMAVPVRLDLIAELDGKTARIASGIARLLGERRTHLAGLARGLPDPHDLIGAQRSGSMIVRNACAWRCSAGSTPREANSPARGCGPRRSPPISPALAPGSTRSRRVLSRRRPRSIAEQRRMVEGLGGRLASLSDTHERRLREGYVVVRRGDAVIADAAKVTPGRWSLNSTTARSMS